MNTVQIDTLTERMTDWAQGQSWTAESGPIAAAAIAEVALGEPVDVTRVAARAGLPAPAVSDFLRRSPAEFDDDGRLVGFGLTLRATAHRFEVGGRTLYTWCAPDTLAFPVVLGKHARIQSPCFVTGEIVRVDVDPGGVREVDPEQAVVSIVTPEIGLADFRQRLCHQQHFFSSAAAAAGWQAKRPEAIVVPVREAFVLARALLTRWLGTAISVQKSSDGFDRALAAIPSCALDDVGRREQSARYARLSTSVEHVQREPEAVVIEFASNLDAQTLEQALAVERACCPFLRFRFDPQRRTLEVTVADAEMLPALDAIADGFTAAQRVTQSRGGEGPRIDSQTRGAIRRTG